MKRTLCLLAVLLILLPGCSAQKQLFSITYLDVFDTVTTIRGYARSQADFSAAVQPAHEMLLDYHRLFDIYHSYDGIHNLKTVNDQAGRAPVAVTEPILALLQDCRAGYALTGGRMNPAMGSVLALWHEAREAGLEDPAHAALPDPHALAAAAEHCSMDTVLLDEAAMTVYLADAGQRLDVGAIAKGWTAQRVSQLLPEGYLLNLGGNICATGPKPDGSPWNIGIQDPDNDSQYLCTVPLYQGCTVTSGDYQRYYTVDGIRYHHIIDPDTLSSAAYWRSVTVLCEDSGLADCLSTALFTLDLTEGTALARRCSAEVLWIASDGSTYRTDGFPVTDHLS